MVASKRTLLLLCIAITLTIVSYSLHWYFVAQYEVAVQPWVIGGGTKPDSIEIAMLNGSRAEFFLNQTLVMLLISTVLAVRFLILKRFEIWRRKEALIRGFEVV